MFLRLAWLVESMSVTSQWRWHFGMCREIVRLSAMVPASMASFLGRAGSTGLQLWLCVRCSVSVRICKCKLRQPEQVYLYTDAHLYCSVHASVPVYTVYMVYTVYIVYKVYMVYTVYTLNTMYTVYSSNCSVIQAMSLSTRETLQANVISQKYH